MEQHSGAHGLNNIQTLITLHGWNMEYLDLGLGISCAVCTPAFITAKGPTLAEPASSAPAAESSAGRLATKKKPCKMDQCAMEPIGRISPVARAPFLIFSDFHVGWLVDGEWPRAGWRRAGRLGRQCRVIGGGKQLEGCFRCGVAVTYGPQKVH
jgi:hypothetical protein